MNTTPITLLEQLRQPNAQAAWSRFVHLYTPLIYRWARQAGLPSQDAGDLVQEVLALLVRKLPEFSYDARKSFRGWLHTVTVNRWRDLQRCRSVATRTLDDGAVPEPEVPDPTTAFDEQEYRQYLVGRALRLMQAEFHPSTWKAFWEYLIAQRPPAVVAAELGITVNAVYLAKSRVLGRLRQQLDGLLD